MTVLYGLRTKDAQAAVTLDTSVTPVRSLKIMTVTGNGDWDQYFSIPEIQAQSFVVVDTLENKGELTDTPDAFWSTGQLHLRRALSKTWLVMILSQGGEPFAAPGTYGIRTRNNDIRTQIDSANRVLTVHSNGAFQFGQMAPGNYVQTMDVTFPSVITTYERPLIFLNAVDYMMVGSFFVHGSPGAWTGFHLRAWANAAVHGPVANTPMTIKWICSTYMPLVAGDGEYGARVSDATGARVFLTTANLTTLNSQPANNSFVAAGPSIAGSPSQQMPWTGNASDYVLANALFSCSNVVQTTQPYRENFGGFWPGNRGILQMYCYNGSGINPLSANGRTLFAARPMRPL
jgi:hypothetical protein